MNRIRLCCAASLGLLLLLAATFAAAAEPTGTLSYRARVVHNDRQALSLVAGTVDLSTGDFAETVERSWLLDWKVLPSRLIPARPELPSIWGAGGRTAQRFSAGLPRYDSPLLRHFLVGGVLARLDTLAKGQQYLNGQLVLDEVRIDGGRYEIIGRLRGAALVVTGSFKQTEAGRSFDTIAVLGPAGELYQYQFEEVAYRAARPEPQLALPGFDPADHVSFPAQPEPVPIRPVKDWLVFQASLPSGRQLNLLFDSGADTMIVDDMVLRFDAKLEPLGEALVQGGTDSLSTMQQYEGFSFTAGGVEFRDLPVLGTSLTSVTLGGGVRIHGIVGNEILQLCQLDLDLAAGMMQLRRPDSPEPAGAQKLSLWFIQQLPHVEAQVQDKGNALFLLDTGQRQPLTVNLDYLSQHKLDDELVMNGFLGGIGGDLTPRYMLEQIDVALAGGRYVEKTVDALPQSTFAYEGVPVAGAIGFSMLSRHFGGLTFDYRRRALYVRDPGHEREFIGRPEAWDAALARQAEAAGVPPAAAAQAPAGPAQEPAADTALEPGGTVPATVPTQFDGSGGSFGTGPFQPVGNSGGTAEASTAESPETAAEDAPRRPSLKSSRVLLRIAELAGRFTAQLSMRSYGMVEDGERYRAD